MAHVYARPHHMLQTEEEVLDIVEDDPSTSTREIARQGRVGYSADLTYYYYSQRNPAAAVKVKNDNLSPLNGWFKSSRDTYFIIHGWKNSYQSDVNVYTKRAILSKYDVNVIVVDWNPIASRNYLSAKWAVTPVGNFVSDFITSLMVKFNFGTSKISIVGHSLGAHVSGIAGAALKRAYPQGVDHIVGLDPALPLFSISDVNNRLDSTDANYVQVIHTCGGMLGFKAPIGHTDYYPNEARLKRDVGWI
ncbi:hypothetical protein NQ317_018000 [Molorchus minor]|uniref:Lipase domain-containing protein n=1 Tax=Molorchus minor TaxID=1323400 RepID=A0ABQ9J049_9CUCU|nr:hypothetical protein NQ317_018000 [Molorchus minor]